jgi:hypothetical protein
MRVNEAAYATITSSGSIKYASRASIYVLSDATAVVDTAPMMYLTATAGAHVTANGGTGIRLATIIGRGATLDVTNIKSVSIVGSGATAHVVGGASMVVDAGQRGKADVTLTAIGGTAIARGGDITLAGAGATCTAVRKSCLLITITWLRNSARNMYYRWYFTIH